MQNCCKYLFLSLLIFTLAGCGFHLRGHTPMPSELRVLYVQTNAPYSDFTKQLKVMLKSAKVTLVDKPEEAPIILQILNATTTQQLTSTSANGQTNTYTLNYVVTYQVLMSNGKLIQGPQTVTTTRNYSITSNQVLGDTTVKDTLVIQMQRDAIYQTIYRLRAPRLLQALSAIETDTES